MCVALICWRRAILSRYKVRSRDQGLAPFQQFPPTMLKEALVEVSIQVRRSSVTRLGELTVRFPAESAAGCWLDYQWLGTTM
jgi:hypothetical protein